MEAYVHTVQYYETDRMGIAHHSNYVRWMEEARIHFLKQIGWNFEKLEAMGLISPVTAVSGKYKTATTFAETVSIDVKVEEFNGIRLKVGYLMKNAEGQTVFEGTTEHCFVDKDGKIVKIKRDYPDFYNALAAAK